MRQLWAKINFKILFFVELLLVYVLCLIPVNSLNQGISVPHIDKMVHFIMYSSLVILALFAWRKKYYYQFIPLFFFLISNGVLIEFLQQIIPTGRSFDKADILVNGFGVLIGSLFYFIPLYKNLCAMQINNLKN